MKTHLIAWQICIFVAIQMLETQQNNIIAADLFARVSDIIAAPQPINREVHDVLVRICEAGLRQDNHAFGNLFSQITILCRRNNVSARDTFAIQTARRHSNHSQVLSAEDAAYDCRALCIFISAVFNVPIPSWLIGKIPPTNKPHTKPHHVDYKYIRCIVKSFNNTKITIEVDQNISENYMQVDYSADNLQYLQDILREGMQLNLLDCELQTKSVLTPKLIIIEPDFLVDISSIARCFTDYGHNPLAYLVNRMAAKANSQAILLGNFAGKALDDIIKNHQNEYKWTDTFTKNFKANALEYATCSDLNGNSYKILAHTQAQNIEQITNELFRSEYRFHREKALLEPSFVCEKLGINGRADLITTDFKLLVEQKSGKNYNIERNFPNQYGYHIESHYVQLLLYYGVLRYNFNINDNNIGCFLLYSKYALPGGLVSINFYKELFNSAIAFRNRLVSNDLRIVRDGFESIIDEVNIQNINEKNDKSRLFLQYIAPQLSQIITPLHNLSPLERAYFCRMITFVYQEQWVAKVGLHEGIGHSGADLWNMPLAQKRETGNIYTDLQVINKEQSSDFSGYDTITLAIPNQGKDFLPNFRRGDMVYVYEYEKGKEPDVRASILYKGVLKNLTSSEIIVHLNDAQQNQDVLSPTRSQAVYAIEHGNSDIGTNSAIRSLHTFITSVDERKLLLLSQREPQIKDEKITLSRSYNKDYDDILLRAKQAKDYFLLIGPPGTGKTSMALRYIVEEELTSPPASILLMAYTNRAVDEMCSMLKNSNISFIRIGGEYTCDERFHDNLITNIIDDCHNLSAIKQRITDTRVVVGTTSSLFSNANLFNIKQFSLAIIDEASQILEPNIVGILTVKHKNQLAIRKFILIGDYKQLPAVVQQNEATSSVNHPLLREIGLNDCRVSLFERLINREKSQHRKQFIGTLRKQGRMHPHVAEWPSKMFYRDERLEIVPLKHQEQTKIDYNLPAQDALDDVLKANRMIFIPSKLCRKTDVSDKVNADEARIVADILRRIYRFYGERFNPQTSVGVIVPYRNQIAMIRKEIEKLNINALSTISIDTVERYQGSQRDVIIYSFTVQNRYQLDFLTSNCFEENGQIIDRKLNVALTRARHQMIITGNEQTLRNNLIFSKLIDYIKTNNLS